MGTTIGYTARLEADLVLAQGIDFSFVLQYFAPDNITPINTTGWTGAAQIRDKPGGTVMGAFTVTLDNVGNITCTLPHAVTQAVSWNGFDRGVWDLEVTTAGGLVDRLAMGKVIVSHDVTR